MAFSAILNFGQCSTFYLDDREGRVILFQDGGQFMVLKSRSNQRSKVNFDLKPRTNHLYRPIICGSVYTAGVLQGAFQGEPTSASDESSTR